MVPAEIILDNRIEKDIQTMMYPVNLVLSLFLSSKYTIKDDYITPKGKLFYIMIFFFVACAYALCAYRMFFGELEDTMGINNIDIVIIMYAFFYIFYSAGFTILFVLNFVHRDINISMILLIQRIYKGLDFSGSRKKVTRWNWITIISVVSINIFNHFLYCGIYDEFYLSDSILNIMYISFDINLVYGILVIILLRKYIEKWIEDVLTADGNEEKNFVGFFDVYRNILEAYYIFKKIFQLLILFHILDTFFRVLCYFSILLNIMIVSASHSDEEKLQFLLAIFLFVLWLAKDIFLIIIQCVECEKFYIAVEETETACLQRLKNTKYSDYEETLCGNVIQANRASFSKMTACGLFHINSSLPLKMMGILTSYVVVMLQSTFL